MEALAPGADNVNEITIPFRTLSDVFLRYSFANLSEDDSGLIFLCFNKKLFFQITAELHCPGVIIF